MKRNTAYFCTGCSYESPKWAEQRPARKAWNISAEEPTTPKEKLRAESQIAHAVNLKPVDLYETDVTAECRIDTDFSELNCVFGGGTAEDSLVLIGGDPGIGRSIILLQVCRDLTVLGKRVLYISGEGSLRQIKLRVERLYTLEGDLRFLSETGLDSIREVLLREKSNIAVIDSIQTMYCDDINTAPGSVSQAGESTDALMQFMKGGGIVILIVGHVTREGQVVGLRVLEHMTDTVLYFEGEKGSPYRTLYVIKNRFRSTNEIGVLEITKRGPEEIRNPSVYMLEGKLLDANGTVVACSPEGSRPILLEIQALVTESAFGIPCRTAAGVDYNRVNLLVAVLEKCCRLPLSHYGAYVNTAGGMRMNEPAMDLVVVTAAISSSRDRAIEIDTVVFGEIGSSDEVRAVPSVEYRVHEAAKLGFTCYILPKSNAEECHGVGDIACCGVSSIQEVVHSLF